MLSGFHPIEVSREGLQHKVRVWGREYTFAANSLPCSIVSQGQELLASPMRIVGIEDGVPMKWDENYPDNESECFIQSRSDEQVVLCGAMQTPRFIVDTAFTVSFDGAINASIKIMPCGMTVAQLYGLAAEDKLRYSLERLWLEIPLKKEVATFFNMYPNQIMRLEGGIELPKNEVSGGGRIPEKNAYLPFLPTLWLGNDDLGLGWCAESDQYWQPADKNRALEIAHTEDAVVLRCHLLDSHPRKWTDAPEDGQWRYTPVSFAFSLQATPVKQFPKQPYFHKALHLDCFVKVKGNYIDYLAQNKVYDLLVEKGVDTLVLHEKWNKTQNLAQLSEFTQLQLRTIVTECHRRGIKVLPYFGYEFSSLAKDWQDLEKYSAQLSNGKLTDGWYRVPYQRDYTVCYNSPYQELWLKGIEDIMDNFHVDGVYLDSSINLRLCANMEHGCGYKDADGTIHGTYPVAAVRRMFMRLYDIVHKRGGIINVHSQGCINCLAMPFIDSSWYGENMQFKYISGNYADMPLDYFRAQYCGRNIGIPVEFIAYEKLPAWSFENAVAMSCIHGILPRPNGIAHPLEVMSPIWNILEHFPVAQSEWHPYWNNDARTDRRARISYYKHVNVLGKAEYLIFCANTTHDAIENFTFQLDEPTSECHILNASAPDEKTLEGYGYKIIYAV
ncbi:MAG: hypothetical protein J5746_09715 [Victivallales bacterium]|nr:hypothetical protein [Victivallales bacterium]